MTHEFKNLIQGYLNARHIGLKCVVATVVALDGSSYRRPGVRMLINENGHMTGAVSGGCVEKEIFRQSQSVFKTGRPKMMSYDGRYRLGCEGVLHILIEKFEPSEEMLKRFEEQLGIRKDFEIQTTYVKNHGEYDRLGSKIIFDRGCAFSFNQGIEDDHESEQSPEIKVFVQTLKPCFRLTIIGGEHDAAQLSLVASHLGWEVTVIVGSSSRTELSDFPGSQELIKRDPEDLELETADEQMAMVLMTHSYAKDLKYLMALKEAKLAYIGLLGPSNRRERILNDLIERCPDVNEELFDDIYGPAGLNIGAETPAEIAMSICSEILSVVRRQQPKSLKDKSGPIHKGVQF